MTVHSNIRRSDTRCLLAEAQKRSNWFHLLLLIENQTSKFLYGVKQERDAHFTIYFQAAVPGHNLEILRLGNFFRSHFLLAEATITDTKV